MEYLHDSELSFLNVVLGFFEVVCSSSFDFVRQPFTASECVTTAFIVTAPSKVIQFLPSFIPSFLPPSIPSFEKKAIFFPPTFDSYTILIRGRT